MLQDLTRSKLILLWFVTLAMLAAAGIALGATVTLVTAAWLSILSLIPPAIVLMLWPGVRPTTAGEVLRDDSRV